MTLRISYRALTYLACGVGVENGEVCFDGSRVDVPTVLTASRAPSIARTREEVLWGMLIIENMTPKCFVGVRAR